MFFYFPIDPANLEFRVCLFLLRMGNVAKHKLGGVTKNEFLRDLDHDEV